MLKGGRRKSKIFFSVLGALIVAAAVALNISWIVTYWRTGLLLVLGVIFFVLIITGAVLNTIFLLREIRRNEQHDAFINSVTHELKTPVASIRLYLQTLQSRNISEDKRKEFYGIMLSDSDRLLHTIEQVLRSARTHARREINRTRVDMRELVQECVATGITRYHLDPRAILFEDELGGAESIVLGEAEELRSAVLNLLDNAVKYVRQDVKITVTLARGETGRIAVKVRDEGIGIAPSELKHVFKRFYRVHDAAAQKVKGTGLGLFIVRSVAERHRGKVYVESRGSGQGSTFSIEVPAAPAHS